MTDTERSARSSRTGFPVQLGLAALVTLFGAWQGFATYLGLSTVHPGAPIEALVYGAAIVGAAFILSWAAEAVQVDINAGLALALLALLAVLPEYAVDFVFTAKCGGEYAAYGGSPEICGLSLANMTGANRVLVGVGLAPGRARRDARGVALAPSRQRQGRRREPRAPTPARSAWLPRCRPRSSSSASRPSTR